MATSKNKTIWMHPSLINKSMKRNKKLEKELEQFKGSFECDEIVEIWNYGRKKIIFSYFYQILVILWLKNHFGRIDWTFDTQLVKIAFENWLVLNLWKSTLRKPIECFCKILIP